MGNYLFRSEGFPLPLGARGRLCHSIVAFSGPSIIDHERIIFWCHSSYIMGVPPTNFRIRKLLLVSFLLF